MPPQPPASVDDLGLQGCLNLWALLTGQERRLAIAPTVRMTLIVMNLLREQGVIEVPWPNAIWAAKPEAEQTPLEGLQWRSEEHTSELQSLTRISYAILCLKKK